MLKWCSMLNEMKVEITLFNREGKMQLTTADGQYSNPLEWGKNMLTNSLCCLVLQESYFRFYSHSCTF